MFDVAGCEADLRQLEYTQSRDADTKGSTPLPGHTPAAVGARGEAGKYLPGQKPEIEVSVEKEEPTHN